jgi:hypothetical protein
MAISITSSAIANWRFYRERTINFFKDRHYLREVPWMDPTRAPWWLYTHIHPAQWEYIYIYGNIMPEFVMLSSKMAISRGRD